MLRGSLVPGARIPMTFPITFAQDLTAEQQRAVLDSAKVKRWLEGIARDFQVDSVSIDRVYFFGSKVGFVMGRAEVRDADGKALGGIALLRGDAVALLPVLHVTNGPQDGPYTILTCQPRVPVGQKDYAEICAGMMDEDGDLHAKMLQELEEEIGLDLQANREELTLLQSIHCSPGGSDERLTIFALERTVDWAQLAPLHGRRTGVATESESIVLRLVRLHDLPRLAPDDMKTQLAYLSWCAQSGERPQLAPRPKAVRKAPAPAV